MVGVVGVVGSGIVQNTMAQNTRRMIKGVAAGGGGVRGGHCSLLLRGPNERFSLKTNRIPGTGEKHHHQQQRYKHQQHRQPTTTPTTTTTTTAATTAATTITASAGPLPSDPLIMVGVHLRDESLLLQNFESNSKFQVACAKPEP